MTSMLSRLRSSLAVASTLATLVLAGCGSELPKDKGVWYICNVSASEETVSLPGQPNGSAVSALFQTRVCGNPGLPASDITGACIEQCENDLGGICLGVSDDFELFMCEPECATIGFLQTS